MAKPNPFAHTLSKLQVGGQEYSFYDLNKLNDPRLASLPYSIRVLLESAVRNCDDFEVKPADVEKILAWAQTSKEEDEIPFKAARVILQDFTGVPAVVDLAAMRDCVARLGGNPSIINPAVPVDLVVDHSVQVDISGTADSVQKNLDREMERNSERFQFLKWGAKAFQNFQIVPPGSGIVHQVNLEYLARVVMNQNNLLYPDSLVGTDSHTTMINGLGVVGWGVGGIEAEAVMLNQPVSMVLPQVVGYKLTGKLGNLITSTDLVLTITEILRKLDVVGKFVEFYGPGVSELSLADRATLANMAPEYGATMGYFPVDAGAVQYLRQTGRSDDKVEVVEAYLRANAMFVEGQQENITYSQSIELDLSTVVPSVAGPKRPQDRLPLSTVQQVFQQGLTAKVGFKSYGLAPEAVSASANFSINGVDYTLKHGSVVIAAITSCTNTSNPSVMLGAGLVARNAVAKGLKVAPYIKTSLAPGSHVATKYLASAGLQPALDALGFNTVGYGCTTCIGNSGDIPAEVSAAIEKSDLVVSAVLSGNRNFEGRVHPLTRANYLASPPLVVAYAIAGTVDIDFETQPIGTGSDGQPVFLRDIWPTNQEVQATINAHVLPSMFRECYASITEGTDAWRALNVAESQLYQWQASSTYVNHPPFFASLQREKAAIKDISNAYCLLNLGDSITTDHISPAGNITKNSPAGRWLLSKGVAQADFNSYGSRRGHDEVMARGTFANTRLVNKLVDKIGPNTLHVPSGETLAIFDAAERYMQAGTPTVILGGAMYGSGSSRDWAAKGPFLQGVKAVISVSFERIHRSNLVGMGIVPLCFKDGEDADKLGLTGKEVFSIELNGGNLQVGQDIVVSVAHPGQASHKQFTCKLRLDTAVELQYFLNGGVLNYVLRNLLAKHA